MQYPRHIALIPDGNRTRAKEKGKAGIEGHFEGFERATEIASYLFSSTPVEVFTLRGLSTENLKERSEMELAYLFELYKKVTEALYDIMRTHQVNFRVAGDKSQLPSDLVNFFGSKRARIQISNPKNPCACDQLWRARWDPQSSKKAERQWRRNQQRNPRKCDGFCWLADRRSRDQNQAKARKKAFRIYALVDWLCTAVFHGSLLSWFYSCWTRKSNWAMERNARKSEFWKVRKISPTRIKGVGEISRGYLFFFDLRY